MVQVMKFYKNFLSLSTIFWCLFVLVTAIILWSIFFDLNKSIIANGQISPEGRPIKVQNTYQGTIANIFIDVGDEVTSKDTLVTLDTTKEQQKLSHLRRRENAAKYEAARLLSVLNLPGGIETLPVTEESYYRIQMNIFNSEKLVFSGQLASLRAQIAASEINQRLLTSRLPIMRKRLKLADSQLKLVSEMQEFGYEGEINVLSVETEYNDALDKIVTLESEIELRENEIAQLEGEISKLINDRSIKAASEYFEISKELDGISSEIREIELFLSESSISAPISGKISRLLFENVGQVIDQGTTLAEILPSNTQNVFYVEIPIASISEVALGQSGQVSLANMDLRNAEQLRGTLVKLDGDVTVSEDGRKFYSGLVAFDDPASDFLVPGVAGTISLELGKRSVFMYIFDPILDTVMNSLRE